MVGADIKKEIGLEMRANLMPLAIFCQACVLEICRRKKSGTIDGRKMTVLPAKRSKSVPRAHL